VRTEALVLAALSAALSAQTLPFESKDAVLGAQMSAEMAKTATLIPDPPIRAYVSELAAKLAGRNLLLTIQVMDSDPGRTHEPVWLPGGYIFISADLIRTARNESELAGMMAHALAHEIGNHPRRIASASPSGIPVYMASPEGAFAPPGYSARVRPFELEADATAVRMLAAAGYDPIALHDYLSRIEPRDNERIEALAKAIGELTPPPASVVVDSSHFRNIQDRLTQPRSSPTLYSPR
jgi:predicted Zn-dependent protease